MAGAAYDPADLARPLETSFEALEWAVGRAPEAWHHALPESIAAGEWHLARILAHVAVYEVRIAAPLLEALAAGTGALKAMPRPDFDAMKAEEETMSAGHVAGIMAPMRAARLRQVDAVRAFDAERIAVPRVPWGGPPLRPAGWVAIKTLQHTLEHANSVLQIALTIP
jgi:hypothetical protein